MTATILTLAFAYGFVLALLIIIMVARRVSAFWRVAAAVLTVGLFVLTYSQIGELRGLPSDSPPPRSFQLHWARVVEPNLVAKEPGHIFLWLEALDEDNYPSGEPRAYAVPYSPDLVTQVEVAMGQIRQGEEIAGQLPEEGDGGDDTAERLAADIESKLGAGPDGGSVGQRIAGMEFGNMEFVPMPAPVTPQKPD